MSPTAGGVRDVGVPSSSAVDPDNKLRVYDSTIPPEFDHVNLGAADVVPSVPLNVRTPDVREGAARFRFAVGWRVDVLVTLVAINRNE